MYSTYDDVGDVWVAQATYRFVYDEWNVVMVLDDNNSTLRKYTWGLDLSGLHGVGPASSRSGIHGAGGIGGLLAVEETAVQDSPAYWFMYDANGNVGQVLDASDQTIAAKYEYDPYGNVITSGGDYASANPLRFSTKWFDTELAGPGTTGAVGTSGLGYWGYRYYSPRLGRWVNRDPIEEDGGRNLYAYALSNPVGLHDPTGQAIPAAIAAWMAANCVRGAGASILLDIILDGVGGPQLGFCECACKAGLSCIASGLGGPLATLMKMGGPEVITWLLRIVSILNGVGIDSFCRDKCAGSPSPPPPNCPQGMFDCPDGCSYVPCDKQDCFKNCMDGNCTNPYDLKCIADCRFKCLDIVWK